MITRVFSPLAGSAVCMCSLAVWIAKATSVPPCIRPCQSEQIINTYLLQELMHGSCMAVAWQLKVPTHHVGCDACRCFHGQMCQR